MLPRAAVEERRQLGLGRRLLFVDHDAEDVLAEFGLDGLETEVRREGAILVDRLATDHAERQDQVRAAVEEDPRARREVLDPGHRVAIDKEPAPLLAEFIDGGGGHVEPGEGRVDDPDALQAFPLRRRGAATSAGGPSLEPEPFRYLPHDLPGPVEVPLEFRQADDLGREATAGALRADPILIVDLIEADRDDVRTDLVEDRVDVPLVPEERTVHRFEALDHLDAGRLGHDRFVLEPAGGRVPGDHDPQLVPELPRLAEEIEVTGMEEIEDPRRHYTDHKRHARTMSWPSRNTRFLARAYAFASSFERARPSSAIISQIVAVGARPAMIISAVVSSV